MSLKKAEIKKAFIEMLDDQLISKEFVKNKNNEWVEYVKMTEWGFNKVTPVINQYSTLFYISLGFSIRIKSASDILAFLNNISDEYINDYATIGGGFHYLIPYPDNRIKVESQTELKNALSLFKGILDNEATVFFNKYKTVASIDLEVNRENLPKKSLFEDVSVQPFVGLTSAVLNKNPQSKYWENYYREKLKSANQHIKNQYEKLVEYLKNNYPGSLT